MTEKLMEIDRTIDIADVNFIFERSPVQTWVRMRVPFFDSGNRNEFVIFTARELRMMARELLALADDMDEANGV